MTTKDKKFESIKSKILKLHTLAERGEQGEAENARRLLENLLQSYGLSLEQILGEKEEKRWYKFKVSRVWEKTLLHQCYFRILNVNKTSYKESRGCIMYELTAYEFAELQNYFEWHRSQCNRELKKLCEEFAEAYIIKHNISSNVVGDDTEEGEEDMKPLTPEQKARAWRIMNLVNTVENTSYHKMIENK